MYIQYKMSAIAIMNVFYGRNQTIKIKRDWKQYKTRYINICVAIKRKYEHKQ